uniref:Histone H2B n=1 Tax=Varanus komodoensis TaxID=61221 RepID=A0A8D2JK08_VARKO
QFPRVTFSIQKKLRSRKQMKLQSCLEHGAKQTHATNTVSSRMVRICSPKLFASKMVRQVLKAYIEVKTKGLVKSLLTDVYNHVATDVESLSQKNQPSPISCSDVQTALKEAMAKELASHSAEPIRSECA